MCKFCSFIKPWSCCHARLLSGKATTVFLVILLIAAGCGRNDKPPALAVHDRLIEIPPQDLLDSNGYRRSTTVFQWDLSEPKAIEDYETVPTRGRVRATIGGLAVDYDSEFPRLVRDVELDAGRIEVVEIESTGTTGGHVQLFWSRQGEDLSPERKIQIPVSERAGPIFRFEVAKHPLWSGSIRRIAVTPNTAPGSTAVVRRIRGLGVELVPDRLVGMLRQPWLVELARETRSALLAPPGTSREWNIVVPAAGVLELSYGVYPRAREHERFRFRVHARSQSGGSELLWERRPELDEPGWEEALVDLSPFAGEEITLVLETVAEQPIDAALAMPVWANPMVLAASENRQPPNVLLIVVDTLRSDHMSAYGYSRRTTPRIAEWARERGVLFRNAVAPAPWTLPSHVSLFTGFDAVRHGVNFGAPADASLETLAETLRAAGYTTVGLTAGAYLDPRYGLAQGFDVFKVRQEAPSGDSTQRELEVGIEELKSHLEVMGSRPFFLFFHTYEVHAPFWARPPFFEHLGGKRDQLPKGYATTRKNETNSENGFRLSSRLEIPGTAAADGGAGMNDFAPVVAAYDSGIAYMDQQVGEVLDFLQRRGLDRNTLVIFTSDHGEMLGEHGVGGHGFLYEENLLVPLIIAPPDGSDSAGIGKVVDKQVRLIDVHPTVLEFVGLESPAPPDGRSLRALMEKGPSADLGRREAWSYAASTNEGLSVRYDNRWKFLFRSAAWSALVDREDLFDLRSDPRESRDLVGESDRIDSFRKVTREHMENSPGLRLYFSNVSTQLFLGTVSGSRIRPYGVVSADLPCPCVEWTGPDSLAFEVPPGSGYTLLLEQPTAGDLKVLGWLEGEEFDRQEVALEPASMEGDIALAYARDGWTILRDTDDTPPGTGIRVWWRGEARSRSELVLEENEELREQLEALGYIQ